jgi:hypothetical protein
MLSSAARGGAENGATGVRPFELVNCADLGDVGPNPADLADSLERFTRYFRRVKEAGVIPLTAGGDHLCTRHRLHPDWDRWADVTPPRSLRLRSRSQPGC